MKKVKFFKNNEKKQKKEKKSYKFRVTFFLSGYNLERYINQLAQKGIKFFYINKLNLKNSIIEISVFDEKKVEKFLKSKNINIINKNYNGLSKICNFFKLRFGILIGIFICFCFYIIFSSYVLKIEIYGSEKISDEEIKQVLNTNGVGIFTPLNSKTNEQIEKIVMDNFDQISMVSVVKKGCSLVINLKEKVINEVYEDLDKVNAIIACEDGVITEIQLISGTALVKVGDFVKAGDVLVAPYIIDSSGKQIPLIAKANIKANVFLTGQSIFESKKEISQRTGNYVSEKKMIFLEKEILTTKIEIPFLEYEMEIKETLLADYLLPINYVIITYYEIETIIVEANFETEKDRLINEAKKLAELLINEDDLILEENYLITEQNGKQIIDYVYTVSRNISA